MAYVWRERFQVGDLAKTFKRQAGVRDGRTSELVVVPTNSLVTVVDIEEFGFNFKVIYEKDILWLQFFGEMAVNLTEVTGPKLIGKHFCPINQLSREHGYFQEKIRAYGGNWSKVYNRKCTHVIYRKDDPNARQYERERKKALEDKKQLVSEEELATMLGYA